MRLSSSIYSIHPSVRSTEYIVHPSTHLAIHLSVNRHFWLVHQLKLQHRLHGASRETGHDGMYWIAPEIVAVWQSASNLDGKRDVFMMIDVFILKHHAQIHDDDCTLGTSTLPVLDSYSITGSKLPRQV